MVVLAGRIHVDVIAVAARVGVGVAVPQEVVTQLVMGVDDTFKSGHQLLALLADGVSVIAVRNVGKCRNAYYCRQ